MATIYHLYNEISECGIFRRVDSRKNESTIYISEGSRPRTPGEYERDYDVDGDDAYYQRQEDEQNAPYVSYEKIDELENVFKYLSEPFATLLNNPFKDDRGVLYANEGKTLVKAPKSLEGEYHCREGVEVIFRKAFETREITKVIFPSTLKEIGLSAFAYCDKLKTADLPESLKKIEQSAFVGSAIESIKIPKQITEIPHYLFSSCRSLEYVELHDDIVELNGDAFESTKKLFDLTLPKHIDDLGYMPFRWTSLTKVTIPGSVKSVSRAAFYDCDNLCYAILEEGIEELCDAFGDCENLEYMVFPASLQKIDEDIFNDISPLLFVPEGTLEHFYKILPERLHKNLREGDVPEEIKQRVEAKIQSIILDTSNANDKDLLDFDLL